jgi:hypothetical protein
LPSRAGHFGVAKPTLLCCGTAAVAEGKHRSYACPSTFF